MLVLFDDRTFVQDDGLEKCDVCEKLRVTWLKQKVPSYSSLTNYSSPMLFPGHVSTISEKVCLRSFVVKSETVNEISIKAIPSTKLSLSDTSMVFV